MADILIRGIEMPKSGYIEMLLKVIDGEIYYNYAGDKEVKSADFIPIPEGHGRLGDLDEMMKYIKDHEYELKSRMGCVGKGMFTYQIKEYANNHTIVPAEGGNDGVQ